MSPASLLETGIRFIACEIIDVCRTAILVLLDSVHTQIEVCAPQFAAHLLNKRSRHGAQYDRRIISCRNCPVHAILQNHLHLPKVIGATPGPMMFRPAFLPTFRYTCILVHICR